MNEYVIVMDKRTLRAFSLKRDYTLLNPDLGIIEKPTRCVESFDGWLPSFRWQCPDWVNKMIDSSNHETVAKYFTAYWRY